MSDVIRTDYDGHGLDESALPPAPWPVVAAWIDEARAAARRRPDVPEPDALSVATADGDGRPHVRTVLLRRLTPDGPGFFTNLASRKALDLEANPAVAAALTWPSLFRAIRFVGHAEPLPRDVVSDYFTSRPWGSRISAWASQQSQAVGSRRELENAYEVYARRWSDRGRADDVPVPDFWGGYLVRCDDIELWGGRRSRLHDRLRYRREQPGRLDDAQAWHLTRLQP